MGRNNYKGHRDSEFKLTGLNGRKEFMYTPKFWNKGLVDFELNRVRR